MYTLCKTNLGRGKKAWRKCNQSTKVMGAEGETMGDVFLLSASYSMLSHYDIALTPHVLFLISP